LKRIIYMMSFRKISFDETNAMNLNVEGAAFSGNNLAGELLSAMREQGGHFIGFYGNVNPQEHYPLMLIGHAPEQGGMWLSAYRSAGSPRANYYDVEAIAQQLRAHGISCTDNLSADQEDAEQGFSIMFSNIHDLKAGLVYLKENAENGLGLTFPDLDALLLLDDAQFEEGLIQQFEEDVTEFELHAEASPSSRASAPSAANSSASFSWSQDRSRSVSPDPSSQSSSDEEKEQEAKLESKSQKRH
jgi:hypothetical protein